MADSVAAFRKGCARPPRGFAAACGAVRRVAPGDEAAARTFVQRSFRPVALGEVQFTGYFEIEVPGARSPGGPYQTPVLRPPAGARGLTRREILGGALAGQGLEWLWLASPADLYFVQLQGSARVRLPDGGVARLSHAGDNGRASVPTSRLFASAGIPGNDLSIRGIRHWIAAHPAEGERRLMADPSYVFFSEARTPSSEGPRGALGVPLTPLRSAAIDPAHVPLGAPLWVDAGTGLRRMMVAQDTGEPIRGPARADLFFGWGPRAEAEGGRMYERGRAWVLVPR